jgi:hypothetical protein
MINFPNYSDLGMTGVSSQTRNAWDHELMLLERFRYYFEGDVFQEKQTSDGTDKDQPLLFPLGVNLVKMLTLAQSDAIFGEWEDLPLQFAVRQDEQVSKADRHAVDVASAIIQGSGMSTLWEHELDRNVYGGGALKIMPAINSLGGVRWARIPRHHFYPVWDPHNPNELIEVYMASPMTREQAMAKYRYDGENEIVHYVEHWTAEKHETYIDEKIVSRFSGENPWKIVPFVYTPRLRLNNWWGDALTPDIMPVQDDLNMRLADISDAINYNAHPIKWAINLARDFNAKNFPLGPNALWNLGRSIGSSPEPKVGVLESKNAISPAAFEYVQFLYDWSRTSVFAPPIAFGEDNGGGQRSGVTLEIRMWPLIKAVRRSRAYLMDGLMRALHISARILAQKNLPQIPVGAVKSMLEGRIQPRFYSIMPRDQAAIVDEVVKLMSTEPKNISLETSQKILGRGTGEVARIIEMMEDAALFPPEKPIDPNSNPNG